MILPPRQKKPTPKAATISKSKRKKPSIDLPKTDVKTCRLPEAYYNMESKDFMFRISADDKAFTPLNESPLRRQLKDAMGYDREEADFLVGRIQMEQGVHYVGPLAGHDIGFYDNDGSKILVTNSPVRIVPKAGDWRILYQFIENLLILEDGKDEKEQMRQRDFFFGWIKTAFEGFNRPRNGTPCDGQALFLAGPAKSGKSLLQQLISVILGGKERLAHPYKYLAGETTFNRDLFVAEHLVIDDCPALKNRAEREFFTAQIKNTVNPQSKRLEGKHKDAIVLNPFWRLSIAINDSDENLGGFLNLDEGSEDKFMIFKVNLSEMPMPTYTDEEKDRFWHTLVSEIPHMLYDLQLWEIPDDMKASRFGVKHYHHPDIRSKMLGACDHLELLALIDDLMVKDYEPDWWNPSKNPNPQVVKSSSLFYDDLRQRHHQTLMGLAQNHQIFFQAAGEAGFTLPSSCGENSSHHGQCGTVGHLPAN